MSLLRRLHDDVGVKSPCPAPLLVDEKIHHQLLQLVFGKGYQEWDARTLLKHMLPLYGAWHAYKQAVVQVWRAFHPFMLYSVHGTMPVGSIFPCKVRLQA